MEVADRSKIIDNAQVSAKFNQLEDAKLPAIVDDDDSRVAKATDNGLLDEVFHPSFHDFGKRLSFYLFGKIVNGYQQEFLLPGT